MYYKVKFESIKEDGNRKVQTVLVEAPYLTDAIEIVTEDLHAEEVIDIRRTNIRETYPDFDNRDSEWVEVQLHDSFVSEKGKEKKIPYSMLIQCGDIDIAPMRAKQIVEQGYDLQIDGVKFYKTEVILDE